MIEHGISPDNLLRTLPAVLRNDKKMRALASGIADVLSARVDEIDTVRIFARIDELPEDLLDILAYDFKVDWYGYDYALPVKRAQFKSSFKVRRHLGTYGAIEQALNDIYPGTEVEEWYRYGGDPYYFRVLLDVTHQLVTIPHREVIRAIEIFKNQRSHLQDNSVIYRSRTHISIGMTSAYVIYGVRLCGTYPVITTQGAIADENVVVVSDADNTVYTTPMTGEMTAGIHPVVAIQGAILNEDMIIVTDADGVAYAMPVTGTNPVVATQGDSSESKGIGIGADGEGLAYSVRFCGTAPGRLI